MIDDRALAQCEERLDERLRRRRLLHGKNVPRKVLAGSSANGLMPQGGPTAQARLSRSTLCRRNPPSSVLAAPRTRCAVRRATARRIPSRLRRGRGDLPVDGRRRRSRSCQVPGRRGEGRASQGLPMLGKQEDSEENARQIAFVNMPSMFLVLPSVDAGNIILRAEQRLARPGIMKEEFAGIRIMAQKRDRMARPAVIDEHRRREPLQHRRSPRKQPQQIAWCDQADLVDALGGCGRAAGSEKTRSESVHVPIWPPGLR